MIQERPVVSVHHVAVQAEIPRRWTHRVMCHSLHLFLYEIQTLQELSAADISVRETFAKTMLQLLDAGGIDVENIWFPEEAYMFLGDFVNKTTGAFGERKVLILPYCYPFISQKSWFRQGLTGPFFRLQTITAENLEILREFVELQNSSEECGNTSWFMQNGDLPHRTVECSISSTKISMIAILPWIIPTIISLSSRLKF